MITMLHRSAVLALLALSATAQAQSTPPRFAAIFTDHAVLQRDQPLDVWGTAAPNSSVTVKLGSHSAAAQADAYGQWRAQLPKQPAGGPYTLSASAAGQSATRKDVMVGDVFLCSGQSNMEFAVKHATNAFNDTMSSANPLIRFANIGQDSRAAQQADFNKPVAWRVAGPASIGDASAVCYHMAKSLQARYKIPVGFINASWGGTTIQGWISPSSLRGLPDYRAGIDTLAQYAADPAKGMALDAARLESWFEQQDPATAAQRAWAAPAFDDAAWPSIKVGARWRESGVAAFKDFSGVAWFRTSIELTEAQARAATHLQLGQIADHDTTWVNGVHVGAGATWWAGRKYAVPKGVFKAGKNVIAIRVLGREQGGGLLGPSDARAILAADGKKIALPDSWRYRLGTPARDWYPKGAPWEVPTSYATLYNGMIAPLAGYKFKAAAWYQGESNTAAAQEYRTLLALLMADWRKTFAQPELPFLVAQLASFGQVATKPGSSHWAELRDAQLYAVRADGRSGLAVTFDYGDRSDIHPSQKTVVGERLARAARAVVYGETVSPGGPEAVAAERSGKDIVVRFKHTNGGLRTYSSNLAIAFEVCTSSGCSYAPAGVNGDTVVLAGANAPEVAKVRYAWADAPYVNLYSADDLPAVPFELELR